MCIFRSRLLSILHGSPSSGATQGVSQTETARIKEVPSPIEVRNIWKTIMDWVHPLSNMVLSSLNETLIPQGKILTCCIYTTQEHDYTILITHVSQKKAKRKTVSVTCFF